MDILYFFKHRTAFIRQFYEQAAHPFLEIKRKIDAEEEPFVPPYSEDGEPPFLAEWTEADESLQILGYMCVSMLSAALQLFVSTWTNEFVGATEAYKTDFKKGSWFNRYRDLYRQRLKLDWASGPANSKLLEELVLARNRIQHPDTITSLTVSHPAPEEKEQPQVLFIEEGERQMFKDLGGDEKSWLLPPPLHVTKEKLFAAITEAEKFCEWIDSEFLPRRYTHGAD